MGLFKTKKSIKTSRQAKNSVGRSPVYSYRSLRDKHFNEPRSSAVITVSTATPKKLLSIFFRNLIFIALASILLYGLWLKPDPQVTVISKSGTIRRTEDTYREGVKSIWEKRILNQSKLTIQVDQLAKEIEQIFPEIESSRVELPLIGKIPNVVITLSEPAMLLVSQKGAYYVSHTGKIMARSDQVKANELGSIPTIRDDSGINLEPGKLALPSNEINTVITLLELSRASNLVTDTIVLPLTSNEIDVNYKGDKHIVKFSLSDDPKQGIGALLVLKEKLNTDSIKPTAYIDLRIPDKAFYK